MTKKHKSQINALELRFKKKIKNKTKIDKIKNEIFGQKTKMIPITDKNTENQMSWFGHVCRMTDRRKLM